MALSMKMCLYNFKLLKPLLCIFYFFICSYTFTTYAQVSGTFGDLASKEEQGKIQSQKPIVKDTSTPTVISENTLRRVDTYIYRCRDMEQIVKKIPANIQDSIFVEPASHINALVQFLTVNQDDQFLKVKNIHDWIADNISYDAAFFLAGNIPDQGWVEVLKRKTSVCAGYAGLFQKMCDIAGITCNRINGYARGYRFEVFEDENPFESNHDWNAVYINDYWYLMDITWDAGYFDGKSFNKIYSTDYLFLEPEKMIYTHIPMDEEWQLLRDPKDKSEIVLLPKYEGRYFEYDLDVIPGLKKVNTAADEASIRFNVPEYVEISAVLFDETGRGYENMTFVQKNSNEVQLLIRFPFPGKFKLELFNKCNSESMYWDCAEFGYIASDSSNSQFPATTYYFENYQCFLYSPLYSPLKVGEKEIIKIRIPGAKRVYMSGGGERFEFDRETPDKDIFVLSFDVPETEELNVYATKDEKAKMFEGIVRFNVIK